ncbi:uncharacterized protein LOC111259227 isoform X2 [Varroa jacobsoni]|uniref:uncharacterized protein LOC111259227 isoform X2 n=1 Tax=Varroa jacobsoni TaxID=62625 RepID=UPI000BF47AC9|nr:uncharacterized protein LOC111259227 isoform X2 [Varroa jacobsoni]
MVLVRTSASLMVEGGLIRSGPCDWTLFCKLRSFLSEYHRTADGNGRDVTVCSCENVKRSEAEWNREYVHNDEKRPAGTGAKHPPAHLTSSSSGRLRFNPE